ncbi:MAG: class I SAM-dependent methyltransferase [Chloroflexi bacterium]|nr:MAG: class I SAM-dependent methyltransferase [Chloroflexota bacterium]
MDHADHVALLRDAIGPGKWADLGSGEGAFTLALADLLGERGSIYSVDKDRWALDAQEQRMRRRFPTAHIEYRVADFIRPLSLPVLDGIVMANSLHFVRDKLPLLQRLRDMLAPDGRFVLVEYDADRGNMWVPHPLSIATWRDLAARAGLRETRELHAVPSRFLGRIYSALSLA